MKFKLLCSIFLLFLFCLQINTSIAFGQTGWIKKPDVSGQPSGKRVKGGGGITAMGDYVYLIVGNNTLDFMRYKIVGDSWLMPALVNPGVPSGPRNKRVKKGAYIVNDERFVYVLKGGRTNEFYRYNPDNDIWDSLPEPNFTKGVKGGFACVVEIEGKKYIYAGSGSNTNEWKRFNTATDAWETPSPETLPVPKVKIGSSLAYNGKDMIYFLRGKGNDFYAANLNSAVPTWTEMKDLPFYVPGSPKKRKVKEGGCIEYYNEKVYAVKGGNTKEFWRYDLTADSWTYIAEVGDGAPIPPVKGIKTGRSLSTSTNSSANANGIFCIIGNNTNEFWFYSDGTPVSKSKESEIIGNINVTNKANFTISRKLKSGTCINYILLTNDATNLKVYKITGELVYSGKSDKATSLLSKLAVGVYILRYEAKGNSEDRKLIIAK